MRTLPIERLCLSLLVPTDVLESLAQEFPTVAVENHLPSDAEAAVIDGMRWHEAVDFRPFDDAVASSASRTLYLATKTTRSADDSAREVLTRYQRYIRRRNAASGTELFDRVLTMHARLHDCTKPLVLADYDHALDTWQWMLRLRPDAPLASQLAALFHDIERLVSEPDHRVEHLAADYQTFKDRHAAKGAEWTRRLLAEAGVDEGTRAEVAGMIEAHEHRTKDHAIALLNDADGLSFFSLNSPGYSDYFGPEQTLRKVHYTLGRLGAEARARLATVRLRADVARLVARAGG